MTMAPLLALSLTVCLLGLSQSAPVTPDPSQGPASQSDNGTSSSSTSTAGLLHVTFSETEYPDNSEASGDFFEGDITGETGQRNAIKFDQYKWPGGVVPYHIHSSYPSSVKTTIVEAMREIESDTKHGSTYCVRFRERTSADTDYIYILPQDGCHSPVGKHRGQGLVSIGNGCERKGTIMHELLHTLGFYHEQNRYDRDSYVDIHWDNIASARHADFEKLPSSRIQTLGTPYDYSSIMHYSAYIFAVDDSKPSITPKAKLAHGVQLGQRERLSTQDVKRIQLLYQCTPDTGHIVTPAAKQLEVDCNFESGFCGMIQDSHDDFQWARRHGSTPTSGTGPNGDHTNGIGYYVYTESNRHVNKYARLKSPSLSAGQHCISFALFDYGSQAGQFNVKIEGDRIVPQTVKRWSGSQRNQWINVKITLSSPATWTLVLESHIGSGSHSDIALDDLQVYKGRCQ